METVTIKIYDPEAECLISMKVNIEKNIGDIKNMFLIGKKKCIKTNLIAYDSFNKSLNIMTPLDNNTTLKSLNEKKFSFMGDYIIFKYD
jgi:hypothetical protein